MGDAACQLAHGLHFLSLGKLHLQRFLFGGVNHIQNQTVDFADVERIETAHRADVELNDAFFAAETDVDVQRSRGIGGSVNGGKLFFEFGGVFGFDIVKDAFEQDVFLGGAKKTPDFGIAVGYLTVAVDEDDADRRVIEKPADFIQRSAEFFFDVTVGRNAGNGNAANLVLPVAAETFLSDETFDRFMCGADKKQSS